jgi:Lipoprotein amino terminal region
VEATNIWKSDSHSAIQLGDLREIPDNSTSLGFLGAPMDVILAEGVVQSLRVPADLPNPAIDIKKSQASTFSVDIEGALRFLDSSPAFGVTFERLEKSIHGLCPVQHFVMSSDLSGATASPAIKRILSPEFLRRERKLEVIKILNFSSCAAPDPVSEPKDEKDDKGSSRVPKRIDFGFQVRQKTELFHKTFTSSFSSCFY